MVLNLSIAGKPTTVFAVCNRTRICNYLWLLANRILNFLGLELLVDKAQINFFSAQELLTPLLAHALFLGCTVDPI